MNTKTERAIRIVRELSADDKSEFVAMLRDEAVIEAWDKFCE